MNIDNQIKQIKNESTDDTEEPIISRFSDDNTFAPRVIIKGDGKNPLDMFEEQSLYASRKPQEAICEPCSVYMRNGQSNYLKWLRTAYRGYCKHGIFTRYFGYSMHHVAITPHNTNGSPKTYPEKPSAPVSRTFGTYPSNCYFNPCKRLRTRYTAYREHNGLTSVSTGQKGHGMRLMMNEGHKKVAGSDLQESSKSYCIHKGFQHQPSVVNRRHR